MVKTKNQEKVWNGIAKVWKGYRKHTLSEARNFLKNKRGKVLDLGCGSGRNFIKAENIEFYGVDFSKEMLNFAKKRIDKDKINVTLKKSEANDLPFENDFFDSAICISVIHCLENEKKREKALKELSRVLKPNAEAMISVWNKNQERFKNSEKEIWISWKVNENIFERYYYLYEKEEFLDLLKKVGFEILEVLENEDSESDHSKKNICVIVRKP